MKSPEMLEWEWEFDKLIKANTKPKLIERLFSKKEVTPEPKAIITTFLIPRRWYQSKQLRLKCTCGWVSEQTYSANPPLEIAYTFQILMRVAAELHWGRECPITTSR